MLLFLPDRDRELPRGMWEKLRLSQQNPQPESRSPGPTAGFRAAAPTQSWLPGFLVVPQQPRRCGGSGASALKASSALNANTPNLPLCPFHCIGKHAKMLQRRRHDIS